MEWNGPLLWSICGHVCAEAPAGLEQSYFYFDSLPENDFFIVSACLSNILRIVFTAMTLS